MADGGQHGSYDWFEPWRTLAKLLNIIASHAVGIIALVLIIRGLVAVINRLAPEPLEWTADGVTVSLDAIVHYFDLAVFMTFFVVAIVDLWKWARRR